MNFFHRTAANCSQYSSPCWYLDSVSERAPVQSNPFSCIHTALPSKASKGRMVDLPANWGAEAQIQRWPLYWKTSHYVHSISVIHSNLLHYPPFILQTVAVVRCRKQKRSGDIGSDMIKAVWLIRLAWTATRWEWLTHTYTHIVEHTVKNAGSPRVSLPHRH